MQLEDIISYNDCMSGIVASLEPDDIICFLSEDVCYLTFTFVSELASDYD
jgi:hypothetical protein